MSLLSLNFDQSLLLFGFIIMHDFTADLYFIFQMDSILWDRKNRWWWCRAVAVIPKKKKKTRCHAQFHNDSADCRGFLIKLFDTSIYRMLVYRCMLLLIHSIVGLRVIWVYKSVELNWIDSSHFGYSCDYLLDM